jgi:hypothetical protein
MAKPSDLEDVAKRIFTAVGDEPMGSVLNVLLFCVGNVLSCVPPGNRREACENAAATLQNYIDVALDDTTAH